MQFVTTCRNTFLIVNVDTLRENASLIRKNLPSDVHMMAVVKANAYGHGIVPSAKAFLSGGADWLAVALAEEGIQLREAGIQTPILVLTSLNKYGFIEAARHGLTVSLHSLDNLHHAQKAAMEYGALDVHLVADTGMNRDGFRSPDDWSKAVELLRDNPYLRLTGAFTHFAEGENEDESFTRQQLQRFLERVAMLPEGIILHTSSSAAMLHFPDMYLHMVRPGIALYGYPPYTTPLFFKPALSFATEIVSLRQVEPGDTISYGRTFCAHKPMQVATLAAGYGDGVSRALSGRGEVLIKGHRCPMVGRICMDQLMVDVTGIAGIQVGDEALLLGSSGDNQITAEDIASLLGTISYEVLLMPSNRVPVKYVGMIQEDTIVGKN